MAEEPGGKGRMLVRRIGGWTQAAFPLPFRAGGWTLRFLTSRARPEPDREDWRPVRWLLALGSVLGFLALALLLRTLLIAFGLIDCVDRWSEIRNSLLVIGVIVGAPFIVWRTLIAAEQTGINQQTHFTDLYTKAVEMLGADKTVKEGKDNERTVPNIEVRLGAIYALQRIMNQSDADYLPILRTLCAYVRENATFQERPSFSEGAPLPEPPEPPEGRGETPEELAERLEAIRLHARNLRDWGERLRKKAAKRGAASAQRPDIRAALDVLCDRPEARRLKLEGIGMLEPPVLDLGDWSDDMTFVVAWGRRVRRAVWCTAVGRWASTGERLDLAGAALQGGSRAYADLRRADLSEVQMQGANLNHALLQGANFRRARMHGTVFWNARMQGSNFSDAHMEGAVLMQAQMQGAVLGKARMQGADLTLARMEGAVLMQARMEGVVLDKARMEKAVVIEARMQGADLRRAEMRGADLRRAVLISADAGGALFSGALLAGADFTDATNLTYDQLASAFGDAATRVPPDLEAQRPRLIADAGWAEGEIPVDEVNDRWDAWRAERGL